MFTLQIFWAAVKEVGFHSGIFRKHNAPRCRVLICKHINCNRYFGHWRLVSLLLPWDVKTAIIRWLTQTITHIQVLMEDLYRALQIYFWLQQHVQILLIYTLWCFTNFLLLPIIAYINIFINIYCYFMACCPSHICIAPFHLFDIQCFKSD